MQHVARLKPNPDVQPPPTPFVPLEPTSLDDTLYICLQGPWCDTRLLTSPSLDVCIKGVPICAGTGPAVQLWRQWPDPWSPNCPSVLQSMIPALVHKTFLLHGSQSAVTPMVSHIICMSYIV